MATFTNIDGEESSTITFTVSGVTITRNSSAEIQEILCIGDPESNGGSASIARVSSVAPKSTDAGLNVRIIGGPSTIADFAVRTIAPSTYGDGGVHRVAQSSAADLNVTVAGYSTIMAVSSLAGAVIVRSSRADALVTVYQSTHSELRVHALPASTLWASSAGFHFDSSGALQIAGGAGVSSVFVNAPSTANAANYLPVRLSDGSTYLSLGTDYGHGSTFTASTVVGPVGLFAANIVPTTVSTGQFTVPWGTPQGALYTALVTDSGASVMDSTNRAINVNVVAGAAAGSTIVTISTVQGAVIVRSTQNTLLASVYQSTAADLNVTVAGYSTIVAVSSLAGAVMTRSSAADHLGTVYQSSYGALLANVHNSTIGDLLASVQQNSTVWQVQAKIQDSSAVGFVGTITRPTTAAQGLVVRTVLNDLQSTGMSTVGQTSTRTALVSSVASQRIKVFAFQVISTVAAASTCWFASSNANLIAPVLMGSQSSGMNGANMAVAPPAWLFATAAGENLQFITPSAGPEFHVLISYFIEA